MSVVLAREVIPCQTPLEVLAEAANVQSILDDVHNREMCWLLSSLINGEMRCAPTEDDKEWQIYCAERRKDGTHRMVSWVRLDYQARQEIIGGYKMVHVPINLQKVINFYRKQEDWVVLPPTHVIAFITLPYNKKK